VSSAPAARVTVGRVESVVSGTPTLPLPGVLPPSGVCHLWSTPISAATASPALLDSGELSRVERFRVGNAREAFITSRAAQRLVLGRYLGRPPGEVRIERDCRHCGGDHGRPYVSDAGVDFSVSHSAGWLLIAVVADGLVGVDIEQVSEQRSTEELVTRVLGPAEQDQFLRVPRDDRQAWFIRAWARKEAVLKLTGHGVVVPLSGIEVTGPVAIAPAPPAGWPAEAIHVRDVPAGAQLRAALATTVPLTSVLRCGPIPFT
jgi:4'-phosphopantetheinyl transferase